MLPRPVISIPGLAVCLFIFCAAPLLAVELPQDHAYQQQLRKYLATLEEKDFAVELQPFTVSPGDKTPDELYRFKVLYDFRPAFQTGLRLPPAHYTLASIEAEDAINMPAITSGGQSGVYYLTWLIDWNYPGNPYYNSRPLKLRAFATAAADMIMHDHANEKLGIGRRSDYLGGTLIWLATTYRVARDVLPPEVRAAYETGLVKFVHRINGWGPTGAMVDMDLFAAVSMRMVSDLLQDPEITKVAEKYVRLLYSDRRYFHPAGYFVDNGCFDTSYNGISLYFTLWATMNAPDWRFIHDALEQAFKLKAHLTFPDPNGRAFGPSSMSSRTSGCPPLDQWNFPPRNVAAGMLTDHALFLTTVPTPEQLQNAESRLVTALNGAVTGDFTPPAPQAWRETHWGPRPNPAYDYYVPGYYERRMKLAEDDSPLLKNPYQRDGGFIETFEQAFLIGKLGEYGFAIHTGPVGRGIHGWGGGALCAFWTPKTGSVMLGRRRGWERQTHLGERADSFDIWRMWPVHAVSGLTADGQVFTSGRIRDPKPVYTVAPDKSRAEVQVANFIPKDPTNTEKPCLQGEVRYARRFVADASGVAVETTISSDGKDQVTELYETIPVFLHGGRPSGKDTAQIAFQVGDAWVEATPDYHAGVRAVKITRFDGAVLITFDTPQRVKLSPEVWRDYYQSQAHCRTILIDLLGNDGKAVAIPAVAVRYTISAAE